MRTQVLNSWTLLTAGNDETNKTAGLVKRKLQIHSKNVCDVSHTHTENIAIRGVALLHTCWHPFMKWHPHTTVPHQLNNFYGACEAILLKFWGTSNEPEKKTLEKEIQICVCKFARGSPWKTYHMNLSSLGVLMLRKCDAMPGVSLQEEPTPLFCPSQAQYSCFPDFQTWELCNCRLDCRNQTIRKKIKLMRKEILVLGGLQDWVSGKKGGALTDLLHFPVIAASVCEVEWPAVGWRLSSDTPELHPDISDPPQQRQTHETRSLTQAQISNNFGTFFLNFGFWFCDKKVFHSSLSARITKPWCIGNTSCALTQASGK